MIVKRRSSLLFVQGQAAILAKRPLVTPLSSRFQRKECLRAPHTVHEIPKIAPTDFPLFPQSNPSALSQDWLHSGAPSLPAFPATGAATVIPALPAASPFFPSIAPTPTPSLSLTALARASRSSSTMGPGFAYEMTSVLPPL